MAMAFGTTKGQAHPNLAGGICTILHRCDAEFFIIGSTFGIGHGVAMEGSSEQLILGSVGQKIACELIDGELIIGKIAVEGIDNPIAEGPCVKAQRVGAIASGICVAGEIEPMAGPFFPKPW